MYLSSHLYPLGRFIVQHRYIKDAQNLLISNKVWAMKLFEVTVILASLLAVGEPHGYMIDPPQRSSMWRVDPKFPHNYNDMELYCGGREVKITPAVLCTCNLFYNRTFTNAKDHVRKNILRIYKKKKPTLIYTRSHSRSS